MTGLIGRECTRREALSLPVLIGQSLWGIKEKTLYSRKKLFVVFGNLIGDYPLEAITYRLIVVIPFIIQVGRTALWFSSFLSDVVPPHPIPNWEVKRVSANNTCFARFREDRSRLGNYGAVF
jgi:hypothetical protein